MPRRPRPRPGAAGGTAFPKMRPTGRLYLIKNHQFYIPRLLPTGVRVYSYATGVKPGNFMVPRASGMTGQGTVLGSI